MNKFTFPELAKKAVSTEVVIPEGKKKDDPIKVTYFDYDEHHIEEKEIRNVEECFRFRDTSSVTWINVDGIYQRELVEKICNHFNVHQVIQDNIVNIDQRPNMEDCDTYMYIVLKMLYFKGGDVISEQVSLILSKNFLITFQEQEGDVFGQIREKIRKGVGKIRKYGNDFLAYVIIDAIVNNYFYVLETIGGLIEDIEEEALSNPSLNTSRKISMLQNEMIYLRKAVWPLREVISAFEKSENKIVHATTRIYVRDLYEHIVQAIESCEIYRETISSMLDIYVSSISNKMNDVMKTLTIFTAVFIPLTFIVGVYGMNFKYLPELQWEFGYPFTWGVMIALTVIMFLFFKKKKWI